MLSKVDIGTLIIGAARNTTFMSGMYMEDSVNGRTCLLVEGPGC